MFSPSPGQCRSCAGARSAQGASVLALPAISPCSRRGKSRSAMYFACGPAKPQAPPNSARTDGEDRGYPVPSRNFKRGMLVGPAPLVAAIVAGKAIAMAPSTPAPNTYDTNRKTPTIAEAAGCPRRHRRRAGNEFVDHLPRVDVPGDGVDVVWPSPTPSDHPVHARIPAQDQERERADGDMTRGGGLRGPTSAAAHHRERLFDAAIELILPT